jgi:hypothetical protein
MPKSPVNRFNCPNCEALYMVVQVQAEPSKLYRQLTCRSCDGPLVAQRGGSFSNIFFSRSAAKGTESLAANILADVVLLLQYGPLDQPKNQCRKAGDCQHRARNYDGTCAPASARQSLRMRSYCLITICEPSNDLRFHLAHRCNQMLALARAWQSTSAASSSVTGKDTSL